jgi:hypothetical protein
MPVWHLTLPAVTDGDCIEGFWGNPYTWPGGWNHFQHKNAMIVTAEDEAQARALAAEHDCPIWLDQAYARCLPLSTDTPGVVLSTGSGADNE